jgi:hypothetical protein
VDLFDKIILVGYPNIFFSVYSTRYSIIDQITDIKLPNIFFSDVYEA